MGHYIVRMFSVPHTMYHNNLSYLLYCHSYTISFKLFDFCWIMKYNYLHHLKASILGFNICHPMQYSFFLQLILICHYNFSSLYLYSTFLLKLKLTNVFSSSVTLDHKVTVYCTSTCKYITLCANLYNNTNSKLLYKLLCTILYTNHVVQQFIRCKVVISCYICY